MGEQLKPCPFCGGDAELQKSLGGPFTEDAVRASFRVVCSDHECQGGFSNFWHTTPEEAVGAWNRRAERTCHVVRGGEPSATGVPRERRCSECGGRLSRFGSFCPKCGARVVCDG